MRENWTESYQYFNKNRCFVLVKNTITHQALSILTRFGINFLENGSEYNCAVTWRNELIKSELNVLNSISQS